MAEPSYLSPEYLRLQWNNFESSFKSALQELREKRDYFDVTLACEDKQIEAHRLILSACSPFFRSILSRNPHQHTILYLKGVSYSHLVNIVDFMYRGHVDVAHDCLQDFLNVAEDLKVQGLSDESDQENSVNASNYSSKPLEAGAKRKIASPSESRHSPQLAKRIKPVHRCSICLKDFVNKQYLDFHIEKQHQTEKKIMIKMEPSNDVTLTDENLPIENKTKSEDTIISNPCFEAEEDNGYLSNMDYSHQVSTVDASAEEVSWEDYEGTQYIRQQTKQIPRTTMNLEEKIQIIEQLTSIPKKSQMDIARAFGISQKQVSRISLKKENILWEYEQRKIAIIQASEKLIE